MRYILLFISLAVWLTIGRFLLALDSIIDLVHFASVPFLVSYLLIFRPKIYKKNVISYCVYFAVLASLVLVYFIAFSQAIPNLRINWFELPIAIYFLFSVYIILWLLDKFINLMLSILLPRVRKNGITIGILKSTIRVAVLIFAVIPYLVAVFSTHWVKFADTANPKKLLDMEYRQVSFAARDGTNLNGWFISSEMSDSTVIIVPGRSPAKNLFLSYAKIFNSSGYNVLLFDLRGNGNSGGHKYSFAVNESNDVLGAIDFLKNNYAVSSKYIFGFGVNEGASALINAAAVDERFAAIVSDNAIGYDIALPNWLANFLPKWMEKTLLSVTKSVVILDIGQTFSGAEGLNQKISQVSPCPVMVANSYRSGKLDRLKTIELYAKAKEPKKLWLPPADEDGLNVSDGSEYFISILEMFNIGRAKQQAGHWRISQAD